MAPKKKAKSENGAKVTDSGEDAGKDSSGVRSVLVHGVSTLRSSAPGGCAVAGPMVPH
jgi:hypothetical protein